MRPHSSVRSVRFNPLITLRKRETGKVDKEKASDRANPEDQRLRLGYSPSISETVPESLKFGGRLWAILADQQDRSESKSSDFGAYIGKTCRQEVSRDDFSVRGKFGASFFL